MTDLGAVYTYLGVQFLCTTHGLLLHEAMYANKILQELGHLDARLSKIPLDADVQLQCDTETPQVQATLYR